MRHVEWLELTNVGGFERVRVDFADPVTVLVGANGSGKSTLLNSLAIALRGGPKSEAKALLRNGAREGAVGVRVPAAGVQGFELRRDEDAAIHRNPWSALSPVVMAVYFRATREIRDLTPADARAAEVEPRAMATGGLEPLASRVEGLFPWFKGREDVENEQRVRKKDLGLFDPQLQAVREVIGRLLPGMSDPQVERDHESSRGVPRFTIAKDGIRLLFDQLSEGERVMLAMAADIARRLAIASPDAAQPLDGQGLVLIDEIELHLHPAWQRQVLSRLSEAFPNVQFVVTTHSPQVLGHVATEAVRLIEDFKVYGSPPTQGRDSSVILETVFDVSARDPVVKRRLELVYALVDAEDFVAAEAAVRELALEIGDDDPEVVRSRTMLTLLAG